jgi:hypothetical protein
MGGVGQATGLVPRRARALPLRDSAGMNRTSLAITHFAIAKFHEPTRRTGRKAASLTWRDWSRR